MSHEDSLTRDRTQQTAYRLWQEAGSPAGEEVQFWLQAKAQIAEEEAKLDREEKDSFPASDPPSTSGVTGFIPPTPVVPPRPPAPVATGWRAEAARRFQAWYDYPNNKTTS